MEILHALLTTFLVGAAATLISWAVAVTVRAGAYVLTISEPAHVYAMDRLIAEIGWCSSYILSPGRMLPADGVHYLHLQGHILASRSSTRTERGSVIRQYIIYAKNSASIDAIQVKITGDPDNIILRYVYVPNSYDKSYVTLRCAPPTRPYIWQAEAVAVLLSQYETPTSAASALICGPTGVGKSTLGELMAAALVKKYNVTPEVVKNFDLTTRGVVLEDVVHTATRNNPVILMLDEFDTTIRYAERKLIDGEDKNEKTSLANTPTTLLAFLDRMNKTQFIIIIATTNKTLEEMRSKEYARYVRPGRFDAAFTASASI